MRAIWRESNIVLERSLITREEEYEKMDGVSFIQYDDVNLEKAKRIANGVDMHGIERVISTKNDIKFTLGDVIMFIDEIEEDGSLTELKVDRIIERVEDKYKNTLMFMPHLKQKLSEKVLYLK